MELTTRRAILERLTSHAMFPSGGLRRGALAEQLLYDACFPLRTTQADCNFAHGEAWAPLFPNRMQVYCQERILPLMLFCFGKTYSGRNLRVHGG